MLLQGPSGAGTINRLSQACLFASTYAAVASSRGAVAAAMQATWQSSFEIFRTQLVLYSLLLTGPADIGGLLFFL